MALNLSKNWKKYENKIRDYILSRKATYFDSTTYTRLKRRHDVLRASIDMNYYQNRKQSRTKNDFLSKIAFPLVRGQYAIRKGVLKASFRQDPLFTLTPNIDGTWESAKKAGDTMAQNNRSVMFRQKFLARMINQVSWLGAGVGYSVWNPTVKKVYRTQPESVIGPDGNNINLGFASRQRVNVRNLNVLNVSLNPLNYYQNQTIHDSDDSDFQGHIERTMLGKYLAMVKKKEPLTGGYDKENIEKCLKNTIQSAKVDSRFEHLLKNQEWSTLTTDVTHWFGNIWIEGNEEDMEDYMVELIDGKIVRFLENPYDEGMSPYTVYQIDERPEYWWGNTDSELVTPHENLMNLLVGMKADNTIRNLEQLIFYRRGTLNPGDINDRHKSGGWIPVDVKDNSALSQLIHRDQGRDVSTNDLDQTIRLVLDSAQRLTPSADLGRPSFAGGVQNKTATAAIQLGEREDVLESDLTETFTYGLKATARKTVLMLQEFLPDQFPIRPDPRGMQELINKTNILGDFDYQVESSLTKNKVQESITLQNTLTQLLNFRLVDQQSIANVDLTKLYREWLKRQNLPVDIDDILPETIQNAVAPQALGMGADVTGAFSPGELAEVPVAPGFNADINTPVSERAQTTGVGIGLR